MTFNPRYMGLLERSSVVSVASEEFWAEHNPKTLCAGRVSRPAPLWLYER
jgi:hypothetical protein